MNRNPAHHDRTKHTDIKWHFIKNALSKYVIKMLRVHTDNNPTDKPGPTSSRERGLHALVASTRCLARDWALLASLKRGQFALLATALYMPLERGQFAERVPAACRVHVLLTTRLGCIPRATVLCLPHELALPSSRVGEACLARKWAASRASGHFLASRAWPRFPLSRTLPCS